jgi:3-methyladenine DNA glycosylase AlkD
MEQVKLSSKTVRDRSKAYDWALRVLAKRHQQEFRSIYHEILDKEFNLKPSGNLPKQLDKYV